MEIYYEVTSSNPLYITTLDNNETLYVYDGYAENNKGVIYHPVFKLVDKELHLLGWSDETTHTKIIE